MYTELHYRHTLEAVLLDPRYQKNIMTGEPRPGHPEGTIHAHIVEILPNLEVLMPKLSPLEYLKLQIIIHVHDTFKGLARPGAAIVDADSHASIARAFLTEFCNDTELWNIVQYHDEPYALWRYFVKENKPHLVRTSKLQANIKNWDLFAAFQIIDSCTIGKGREPLLWFFGNLAPQDCRFNLSDVIPPKETVNADLVDGRQTEEAIHGQAVEQHVAQPTAATGPG